MELLDAGPEPGLSRREHLHDAHQPGGSAGGAQANQGMHVVLDTADRERLAALVAAPCSDTGPGAFIHEPCLPSAGFDTAGAGNNLAVNPEDTAPPKVGRRHF